MTTILVTGCAGMIGYATTRLLLKSKYKVIGIDNFNTQYDKKHFYQKKCLANLLKDSLFHFYEIDIVKDSLIFGGIDAIIHLAAHTGIKFSYDNPERVLMENQKGLQTVLTFAKYGKIPLLFASSSSIYGQQEGATDEKCDVNPLSIYAHSKKMNEDTAKIYFDNYGSESMALRFFTVYGMFNRPDMLVHKIINSIIHKTPLTLYNNGLLQRDFTFVSDVAKAIVKLLEYKLEADSSYEIFNIGASHSICLQELVGLFEDRFNMGANILLEPQTPVYEVKNTWCNNAKLLAQFPDFQFTPISEGIGQTVECFKTQGLNEPELL